MSLRLVAITTAAAQATPPPQDYVFRFAGKQYAVAPDDPALDLGNEFSMMGWSYFERVRGRRNPYGASSQPLT